MGKAEPEGCWFEWDDHTCLEDRGHDGPHRCSDGAECPEPHVSGCDGRRDDEHGTRLRCILSHGHERGHVWQRDPEPDDSEDTST